MISPRVPKVRSVDRHDALAMWRGYLTLAESSPVEFTSSIFRALEWTDESGNPFDRLQLEKGAAIRRTFGLQPDGATTLLVNQTVIPNPPFCMTQLLYSEVTLDATALGGLLLACIIESRALMANNGDFEAQRWTVSRTNQDNSVLAVAHVSESPLVQVFLTPGPHREMILSFLYRMLINMGLSIIPLEGGHNAI